MQIVIDISKEKYDEIMAMDWANCRRFFDEEIRAIHDGTPLPKGHGRLKDVDKIEWYGCTTAFDCPHKDRECKDCDRAECSKTQVDDIPTIVKADTESEGEE